MRNGVASAGIDAAGAMLAGAMLSGAMLPGAADSPGDCARAFPDIAAMRAAVASVPPIARAQMDFSWVICSPPPKRRRPASVPPLGDGIQLPSRKPSHHAVGT